MTVPLQLFGKTGSLQLANDGRLKNGEKIGAATFNIKTLA
jgi:hypothetical protein